jgi:hypothetical protein
MKIYSKTTLFILASILFFTVSCKKYEDIKKISSTSWNPNLAAQIAYASFDVYDVLANFDSTDLVVINPVSGQIGLVYNSQIASFDANQIVAIAGISHNLTMNTIELDIPSSPAFFGTSNSFKREDIALNVENGAEIHTVKFNGGILELDLQTSVKHNLNVNLTFPDLQNNGVPVERNVLFTYNGITPQTAQVQIDLAGLDGDFTKGGTTVNVLEVEVTTQITGTGQNILGNEVFEFNAGTTGIDFENVYGYFGQQQIAEQTADSVLIRIFENATEGVFELSDPKINFKIENSFGFPVNLNLANLKSINVNTGQELPLEGFDPVLPINFPPQIGQSATTDFEMNSDNTTNISTIISPAPKYFYYEISAIANPNGPTGTLNFIENDSKFILTAEVDMPLDGLAYGFKISDTVDYSFENPDEIESVMVRLIADNGFPVQVGSQIVALDENDNVVFTLFDQQENLISPAPVNANGVVTSSNKKISDITLNEAQVNLLGNVKKFILAAEASTTEYQNGVYVKFFDYYKIDLKLAVQVQLNTSF